MGNKYISHKAVTPIQQCVAMRAKFPDFEAFRVRGGYFWVGVLQPTSLSRQYKVKIEFIAGNKPKIYIIAPKLISQGGKRPPHIYSEDRPCIYFPFGDDADWNDQKYITDTIIPWYSLWLYYYEIWLATDEWLGEGVHVANKTYKKENKKL